MKKKISVETIIAEKLSCLYQLLVSADLSTIIAERSFCKAITTAG